MTRAVPALLVLLLLASPVFGSSSGITGFSGNPATNGGIDCNVCHSGGIVPTVSLSGPTQVSVGTVSTYRLTVRGGQMVAGGFDVSAGDGSLAASQAGTQLLNDEVTHTQPRPMNASREVIWDFEWTAPAIPGQVTLYGAGNSVDLMGGNNGDAAATSTLNIDVIGMMASGPGESSATGIAPLLVTGYDKISGELSLTYEAGCQITDHNIYYGPLDQVGSLAYDGETCAVGAGGAVAGFNPGAGSFFFLIVGHDAVDEGSYGVSRLVDGSTVERAPFAGNLCGQVQMLADRCD